MKTFRLLIAALLVAAAWVPASAQRRHHRAEKEYDPTVYLISVHEVDTFMMDCNARQQAALMNRLATASAVNDYQETWRPGFQQVERPQFVFASKNNRFSLALGGYINLRGGYDFDGIVDNIDFVPRDIPMNPNYNTSQKLMMDATTSRLFLKAVANTERLGRVVVFIDGDFRGGSEGSYTPRVRSAYVSMLGFTLGRDVTTFCDLLAAPTTVDFQGPNAYNFRFTTLVRFEHSFWNDHMSFALAAEKPYLSATYGEYFAPIHQRMPDFPVYLQFKWGRNRMSHIRASAVFRNMYAYNLRTDNKTSLFGWGAQVSGHIVVVPALELFFNGVYGEGISPYIQDLTGAGLDFTPNPASPTSIQATPMMGWQAAARINLVPRRLSISGGYSTAEVHKKNGVYSEQGYREGQYIFGNIFYHITPRCQIAAEYLYGTRKDMNGLKNHANRANLMVQYSF